MDDVFEETSAQIVIQKLMEVVILWVLAKFLISVLKHWKCAVTVNHMQLHSCNNSKCVNCDSNIQPVYVCTIQSNENRVSVTTCAAVSTIDFMMQQYWYYLNSSLSVSWFSTFIWYNLNYLNNAWKRPEIPFWSHLFEEKEKKNSFYWYFPMRQNNVYKSLFYWLYYYYHVMFSTLLYYMKRGDSCVFMALSVFCVNEKLFLQV